MIDFILVVVFLQLSANPPYRQRQKNLIYVSPCAKKTMFFSAVHHLCAMTLHEFACIRCFWPQLPSDCGLLLVWALTTQLPAAHCNAALELVQLSLLPSSGAYTIAIKHDVLFFLWETGNAEWKSVVSVMNRFSTIIDSVALEMV